MAAKSISKSVVWQLIGKFSIQGILFITTPIFTRILTPDDYGYTSLYASWVSIFSLIVGLQTYGSIANARIKYEEKEIDQYLSSILTISFIMFLLCLSCGFIMKDFLAKILNLRSDLVILAIIHSFSAYIVSFYTAKLDQFKCVEKSTGISVSLSLIILILSFIAVVNFSNNKAIWKIYAQALPTIVFGLFLFIYIYIKGKTIWNKEYNKYCLALTLPLVIHGLGGLIYSQSDRIMLSKLQNQQSLGIYSVSYSLCNILTIIYGALNVSWVPFYMDFKKQENEKEILTHSKRYIKFFTIICIGFILLAYDVFKLMAPEEYWFGINILPIFTLAFYFDYLYLFPVNFEFFNCKTKLIPIATFITAIINIIINLILIPKYGIMGAAIGTLIAHFLAFVIHFIFAKYLVGARFEYTINYFLLGTTTLLFATIISLFLKNLIIVRWIIAVMLGIYLVIDIIKNRSIF